jgi:transcriptional regulator with XRE-family HTH domain
MDDVPLNESNNVSMPKTQQLLDKLLKAYTQEELAKELEVSAKTIYNYTTGVMPRRNTLKRMEQLAAGVDHQQPKQSLSRLDDRIDSLEASLMYIKGELLSLSELRQSLQVLEALVKALSQQVLRLRSESKEHSLTDLQLEMNKGVAEALIQIQQEGIEPGEDN